MPDYLNFELHIIALEGDVYSAQVLRAPHLDGGEPPSGRFQLPYDAVMLNRIILVLSGERRARGNTPADVAKQFGEALFRTVFAGDVLAAYQQARQLADERGKGLRVRLNLSKAGALGSIPWEYLREPGVDYLVLSRATPLVRDAKQWVNRSRLKTTLPLRILVMISAPGDLPQVDEATERHNLERATIKLQERGLVELEYLEDASLRTLQRVLRQGEFHVFHFIGHGAFSPESGVGTLMLEDPYGEETSYPIRGEALARELHEEETLRLVVLNACQGARSNDADPFSGVASSLVQRGIPAVVAQQFEITDRAAIIFSEEFYRAVAEGFPIEAAVAEGRRAIATTLADNIEWGTPVLFLNKADDQRIFDFPAPTSERPPLWVRLTSRDNLPLVLVALAALIVFGVVLLFSGVLRRSTPGSGFAPPTATPIPNVDLVISEVRLSPRSPKPGELVAVFVDVENRGADAAPPFSYEWQANIFDPASVIARRVEGLAAGGVLRDSFSTRLGWWGVFISEARADTANEIIEISEQNNRPSPIRTDNTAPFVIDFSEPLPDGSFVTQNMPVPFAVFETWGFRVETAPTDPACIDAIPWFKFAGISSVALGTGLPTDPGQCESTPLVFTFIEPRPDNNPSGVSRAAVVFAPGVSRYTVTAFADVAGTTALDSDFGISGLRAPLTVTVEPGIQSFERIFRFQVQSDGAPIRVAGLTLTAP